VDLHACMRQVAGMGRWEAFLLKKRKGGKWVTWLVGRKVRGDWLPGWPGLPIVLGSPGLPIVSLYIYIYHALTS
jgi:hypothetical protein